MTSLLSLEPAASLMPRYEKLPPLILVGLRQHYAPDQSDEIPALWEWLAPYLGKIPGQKESTTYGVSFHASTEDGSFDYLAGVEVTARCPLANEWAYVDIPAQHYAVFEHRENVLTLEKTVRGIFDEWLPQSDVAIVEPSPTMPRFLERYSEEFNPHTGRGGMEIWLPIVAR